MANVLLHAGLPKTGTTTVQNWLVENAALLRANGIFTLSRFELAHRIAIEGVVSEERRAKPDFPSIMAWQLEEARAELAEAARDPKISRIVLSSEYFSIAEPHLIKQFFEGLSLNQVTVIFALRRQDRFIESSFGQEVRAMSVSLPIREAVYHVGNDWDVLVSAWEAVFARENIVVRLYDEFEAGEVGIVSQVFASVDPALTRLARERAPVEARSNTGLPAALTEFKRLANSVGAFDVISLLERANQGGLAGPPFRMNQAVAKRFLDIYRESNRRVANRFFQREGDLFDESDLEGEPTGADYTGRLPTETIAMLLALHLQDHAEQTRRLMEAIEQLTAEVRGTLRKLGEPQEG